MGSFQDKKEDFTKNQAEERKKKTIRLNKALYKNSQKDCGFLGEKACI